MTNTPATRSAPVMRGLHNLQTKRHVAIAFGLSAAVGIAFKLLISDPRKAAYAEFYKNYDAEKSFEKMRAKGLFQSC